MQVFQSPPHDFCDSIIDLTRHGFSKGIIFAGIRLSFHPSFSDTCQSHPRTFRLSQIQPRMTEAAKLKGEPMSLFRPRCVCNKTSGFWVSKPTVVGKVETEGLECSTSQRGQRGPLGFVAWTTCHDSRNPEIDGLCQDVNSRRDLFESLKKHLEMKDPSLTTRSTRWTLRWKGWPAMATPTERFADVVELILLPWT